MPARIPDARCRSTTPHPRAATPALRTSRVGGCDRLVISAPNHGHVCAEALAALPALAMPVWAQDMRDLFRSGSVAQFLLYGNIFDLVPAPAITAVKGGTAARLLPLKQFLEEVMFAQYDVVLQYDRGKGIRPTKGAEDFGKWLESLPEEDQPMLVEGRGAGRSALEIIDRYLLRTLNLRAVTKDLKAARIPEKIAVIIDFAQFVVPAGNALQLGSDFAANIVKTLTWANDPAILQSNIITGASYPSN